MKYFIAAFLLLSSSAFAGDLAFNCKSSNDTIKLEASLNDETAEVRVYDQKNVLDIRELNFGEAVSFERSARVNEAKYAFARFYSDFNAWQGIEVSLPKAVLAKTQEGSFIVYLTVFTDDGDRMVPGESNQLLCKIK